MKLEILGSLLAISLIVTACEKSASTATAPQADAPEKTCVSSETVQTLKNILFNNAKKQNGGDPVNLNDLAAGSVLTIEVPLLKSNDTSLHRITCSGRLHLTLPTGASAAFGGDKDMDADVEYSAQPAADGNGVVYQIDSAQFLISRLAEADLSRWLRTTTRPGDTAQLPTPPTGTTTAANTPAATGAPSSDQAILASPASFNCALSNLADAERTICANPELAKRDLQMAARYGAFLKTLTDDERTEVRDAQRRWLETRNNCRDIRCLTASYNERMSQLGQ